MQITRGWKSCLGQRDMKKLLFLLVIFLLVSPACGLIETRTPVSPAAPVVRLMPTASVPGDVQDTPTLSPSIPKALSPLASNTVVATTQPTTVGRIARQHILALSETIGPRVAGTLKEAEASRYIRKVLQELGYAVQLQTFSLDTEDDSSQSGQASNPAISLNVIAVRPGTSTREIIVGAHYDSVEVGRGADDNASGVGVMLEVAGLIRGISTPYTVRFIAFGAEETGLNGSRSYVDHMRAEELRNTVAMINLDSLIAGDIAYAYGSTGSKSDLRGWILDEAQERGFELQTQPGAELDLPDGTPCDCSDYAPFEHAGVPFVYFEATNWKLGNQDGYTQVDPKYGVKGEIWHTEFDNLGYIEQAFPGRIGDHLQLFAALLYEALTRYGMTP
jgi:alkaline phosphatase isozyme conversion protein